MNLYNIVGVVGIAVSVNQMLSPLVENKFLHLAFFFMAIFLLMDEESPQSKKQNPRMEYKK